MSWRKLIATALVAAVAGAALGEAPVARERELMNLLLQDCGSCHGYTLKGGLGPALTPDVLRDRPPEALAITILDGVPGSAMPPWRGLLSEQDVAWLVETLRRGVPR